MQRLMEHSALVIIDVDDAIALGYAKLNGTIRDMETNLRNRLSSDIARGLRTADVIDRSVGRTRMYQVLDTVKIDTSNKTVREIADEILKL